MQICRIAAVALAIFVSTTVKASAGPIILGGDDLNDHGSAVGGVNQLGWRYIQNALLAINTNVTRTGPFTVDIVELGHPSADPALTSAAAALGLTTVGYGGAAGLTQFFTDLANGTVNPRILYSPGTDYTAVIDGAESAVLAANANAINAFVASGGGLMSHGGANTVAYSYLTALLPGIVMSPLCTTPGATLTAAGQANFPQVTNADINAGPCHGSFSGNLGGLVPLALDASGRAFIIGGIGGSITDPDPRNDVVPEPGTMLLLGSGLVAGAMRLRRRKR